MRVLIASDKFKGSLTAVAACNAMAAGVRDAFPDVTIDLCPMSDGGEGFVDAMCRAGGGRRVTRRVTGPLPEMKVDATFAIIDGVHPGDTAVIEMSAASGLALLPKPDRNPLYTTTFGAGELIRFAVEMECRRVLLGIGGSATCDAGIGCLQACGCHVILASEQYASMTEPLCGRDMDDVVMIKSHRGSRVDGVEIVIACDVTNPLYGPNGSASVYAPQKGASPDDVRALDRMLASLSTRLGWEAFATRPGSGAAGGIGCGLAAMFGATLTPGFAMVSEVINLSRRIGEADVILTGEGRFDATSLQGKTTGGVMSLCETFKKRCLVFAGSADRTTNADVVTLVDGRTSETEAMAQAGEYLCARVCDVLQRRLVVDTTT